MILSFRPLVAALFLFGAIPVHAAPIAGVEIDRALAELSKAKADTVACLQEFKTTIRYDVEQRDLNQDGANELIVKSMPAAFGEGPSQGAFIVCFGDMNHIDLLVSDGRGGWLRNFGTAIHGFEYHPRSDSAWPDIETTGPGFCFPIYRHRQGRYSVYLGCDRNNRHVRVDESEGSMDMSLAEHFMPVVGIRPTIEFIHNGSLMLADPARGEIAYKRPKSSIARLAKPGMVVFRGQAWNPDDPNARLQGMAFTFKKGCDPAGYLVEGRLLPGGDMILQGPAPVRGKGSCVVIGFTYDSNNANLAFSRREPRPMPVAVVPAGNWVGSYSGECSGRKDIQCEVEIDSQSGGLLVTLTVAERLDFSMAKCRLEGHFKQSAAGIRGILGNNANIQIRRNANGTIKLAGLPNAACRLALNGQYQPYGDI